MDSRTVRRAIASMVLAIVVIGAGSEAIGGGSSAHYRMVRGIVDGAPLRLVVRCESWQEDSGRLLVLVDRGNGRDVYRCLRGSEV